MNEDFVAGAGMTFAIILMIFVGYVVSHIPEHNCSLQFGTQTDEYALCVARAERGK